MFSFTRSPKRQVLRNPWTNKRKNTASPAVLVAIAGVLFSALLFMAWLLLQAFQLPRRQFTPSPYVRTGGQASQESQAELSELLPLRPPSQETQDFHPPPPMPSNPAGNIPVDLDQVGSILPQTVEEFRSTFEARFGPEVSQLLRQKALQAFGSTHATALRYLQAIAEGRPFRMGFAGYSITVGRGNFYHQSYPFVLYHILKPLLQNTLGLSLAVSNAAIGGIPSFPYGFCMEHFLGTETPDVISWDYSMNEGGTTAVLEAYVRHSQLAYSHSRPLVLALDKNRGRCQLLNDYSEKGLLKDALCVAKASDIIPKSLFDKEEEIAGFLGLQKWGEFGAPKNCPGRGSWHPKKMEHAAIAWTIATYFVDGLELALQLQGQADPGFVPEEDVPLIFPPPLSSNLPENPPAIQSLLFGHGNGDHRMHSISCRTNFEPAADHENLLTSIITSGLVPGATSETILEKRSDEMYNQGWVLDVSQLERETKIKVDRCGGLGYVDMKMAVYGVGGSGPLDLWLPVEESGHESHGHIAHDDSEALHWIESLVLCEANEKRPDSACRLSHDLQYTVGGVAVEVPVPVLHGAGEYLKRPTCVAVTIPLGARLTQNAASAWGLPVRIQAASHITRSGGACCISHLIWEHVLHED